MTAARLANTKPLGNEADYPEFTGRKLPDVTQQDKRECCHLQ